jgi:uncharacterized membrane protein
VRWSFHGSTYVFVLIGLILLWRTARHPHLRWSSKLLAGKMLMGFWRVQPGRGLH